MVGNFYTGDTVSKRQCDIRWVKGVRCEPFEYRCSDCGQLRLSYVLSDTCAHCGSDKITKGKPGTLEKESAHGVERQDEGMGRR